MTKNFETLRDGLKANPDYDAMHEAAEAELQREIDEHPANKE